MDVLSDVLQTVRLSGAVFLRGEFISPWGIISPPARDLAKALAPEAKHLVIFHIVISGELWIELGDAGKLCVAPSELALIAHGDAHNLVDQPGRPCLPMSKVAPRPPWSEFPIVQVNGDGSMSRILCGYFAFDNALFSPLFSTLPPLLHVRSTQSEGLALLLRQIVNEAGIGRPGNNCVATRLTELLFIEILRSHMEQLPQDSQGWLMALKDPLAGLAIRLMHENPEIPWTVEQLARRVYTSRSTLAERFKTLLGYPPMQYLARWRVQLATEQLLNERVTIAGVAANVGYESEAAFHRAFKRHMGESPGHWRQRMRQ